MADQVFASGHKRLILHIGLHKTGSTSFQTLLAQTLDTLQNRGVYAYTDTHYQHTNIALVCNAIDVSISTCGPI